MKINNFFVLVLFITGNLSYGQAIGEKLICGKITVDSVSANGINVLNLINEKATVTDKDGTFFILAKINDVLIFTAVNLEPYRLKVETDEIESSLLSIKMLPTATKLREVIVIKNQISLLSLGITTKDPFKYSPAERKLKTAGDFKPIMLLGLLGGSMKLDPLINKINGRTKRLKKLVALEKKETNIKLISEMYQIEFFTLKLGIPVEYVNGFKYYIVENEFFLKVLESHNEEKITFFIIGLAQEYKKLTLNKK